MKKSQALPEENSLAHYFKEIVKNEALSAEEEAQTARRIHKGDRDAVEKLVKANLRFAVSVARNYQNQGLPLSDLIHEGNLGLIRAARRFDETKNFKFISYAVWWIRQGILQALARQSRIVKLPLNRVGTFYKIGRAQRKLEQKFCRTPNVGEIARELDIGEEEVWETMRIGNSHVSLDAPLRQGEDGNRLDLLEYENQERADDGATELSLHNEIGRALDTLTSREKQVIKLYFGIGEETPFTLDQIGRRLRLTRERIRQIKQKALRKLKRSSRARRLKTDRVYPPYA
jgi:RNA polymerase primary sigma factor